MMDDFQLAGNAALAAMASSPGGFGPWLLSVLLLSLRMMIAIALSPPLASYGLPVSVRLVLVFLLAVLTQSASDAPTALIVDSPERFLAAAAAEVFLGMLLGLGVHVALAAFAVAGRLLDVQIGFGIGSIFDPVTRSSQGVMGSLMSLVGVTLFFVVNAHLSLAAMLASSLKVFPIGQFPAFDNPFPLLSAAGGMFAMGLSLAAPVAIALVLTDLFVGITSRNMPQINVLVLSIPLKVLIAYFVLALSVRAWSPIMGRVFGVVGDVLGAR
jgi:flagellar biosynthetic protein FliR